MFSVFCLALFLCCAHGAFDLYCPQATDLAVAYIDGTTPTLSNQGWTLNGGGGVSTKSAFNLLGGYVEYDIDVSRVTASTNANIYTISPQFAGGPTSSFNKNTDYCDGQGGAGSPSFCNEIDWIESNGACGGATAIHTKPGGGVGGCDAWGCNTGYAYGGKTKFHMKAVYGTDASFSLYRDGVLVTGYSPAPTAADWSPLQTQYSTRGAVIYSTQWQGWVPTVPGGCPSGGSLSASVLTISNLVVYGDVKQGPIPTRCANAPPVTPTPPVPVPVPQPLTSSGSCSISGANNNNYYYEVTSVAGASVSIKCSSGYVEQCTISSWAQNVYQCSISNGQVCSSPNPTCGVAGSSNPVAATNSPTSAPVAATNSPTKAPVAATNSPTKAPVAATNSPTKAPVAATNSPTKAPVVATNSPTKAPVVATNSPTKAPVVATNAPTKAPVAASSCVANIEPGGGSNDYWNAVAVDSGATTVKVTCTDTTITSSCAYNWLPSDNRPIYGCQMSGFCANPVPSCTKGSGSRLSGDDTQQQTDSDMSSLLSWQIALIALACVFAVVVVIAAAVFVMKNKSAERI